MSADYYSDRVGTPRARTEEAISKRVWDALTAEVQTRVESGAFGSWFPRACPKSTETIGCDASVFWKVAGGHLPDWHQNEDELPPTLAILDFLEFCHERVADPVHVNYDAEFGHYHLGFYPAAGQENFRRDINAILTRNGLAYELESNGKIERIPPPVLREALRTVFSTGDAELDGLLNQAVAKYPESGESVGHGEGNAPAGRRDYLRKAGSWESRSASLTWSTRAPARAPLCSARILY
jgi:hypothetical protein